MKLETYNVRYIEAQILDELCLAETSDDWSAKIIQYIAGVHDMANLIIEAIEKLK